MPLTDMEIRTAKPGARLVKLSDGGGLQLWIMPDGAKRWRFAYRLGGAQKLLAIGVYPATGLREAREAREEAKRLLADGQDPAFVKKVAKAAKATASANTFEAVAGELLDKKRREGKAEKTIEKLEWLLGLALPFIGNRCITEITAPEILAVLRRIEARGRHETATRLREIIGGVFRFAVATGRAQGDPTGALRGALTTPKVQHRAAIIEPKAFGGLLRALAGYDGAPETRAALELLALTFVRPGELRAAEWAAASRPARAARRGDLARASGDNRRRKVPFPLDPLGGALHVGKHRQRRLASARLRTRRNDRPRLPLGGVFDAERIRPVERRRHRTPTGACRQR